MELKITLRNHYEAVFHAVFVLIGLIIASFYFFHQFEYHPSFFIGLGIWYVLTEGPGLYLHLEYYFRNKGEAYSANSDGLLRKKDGCIQKYKSDDIDKIVVYMSPNKYKKWRVYFFAMEEYHYARVYLNNGERLYITCLLAPRLDKVLSDLKGVPVYKKKWLFNSTYIPESWY